MRIDKDLQRKATDMTIIEVVVILNAGGTFYINDIVQSQKVAELTLDNLIGA